MNMKKIKNGYNSMEEKYKNNPIYPMDDKLLKKCVIVELINKEVVKGLITKISPFSITLLKIPKGISDKRDISLWLCTTKFQVLRKAIKNIEISSSRVVAQ